MGIFTVGVVTMFTQDEGFLKVTWQHEEVPWVSLCKCHTPMTDPTLFGLVLVLYPCLGV